jgi:hypothetical protein
VALQKTDVHIVCHAQGGPEVAGFITSDSAQAAYFFFFFFLVGDEVVRTCHLDFISSIYTARSSLG